MKCIKVCPLAFLIGRLLGNNVTSQVCLQCKQMQSRECYIEQNVFEKSVKPAFCCTCTVPQVYLTQLCTRRYRIQGEGDRFPVHFAVTFLDC